MKKLNILLAFAIVLIASSNLSAQGRFGKDSLECIKYLSFYSDYMKIKKMDEATPMWRKAIKYCPPQANQNMLLDGMKIIRKEIYTYRNNPIRKQELLDTLFMLHDMRCQTYPKYKVTANSNRALDFIKYLAEEKPMEGYKIMSETMDQTKEKTPISVIVRYMHFAVNLYNSGELTTEDVFASFAKSIEIAELVKAKKPSDNINNAIADIENIFMQSGVATCESLVNLFQPRYDANQTSKEVLAPIVQLMSATNCIDEPLFRNALESLYKIEPTCGSAYLLYKLYYSTNEIDTAKKYMLEAISSPESTPEQDAMYYYELATGLFKKSEKESEIVAMAKKVVELSPELAGKAYMLIGNVWTAIDIEGNDIQKRSRYWIAVDYLLKAKKADPTLAASVNEIVANCVQYYPQQSEAFMYDVIDGASYTVRACGMTETTIVRTQK